MNELQNYTKIEKKGCIMNFKRKLLVILCVTVCLSLVTIAGCKKSSDVQMDPSGALLQSTSCKQFMTNVSGQMDDFAPGSHDDCIEYQYNGSGTLVLRHINAGFNCCPGDITADIEFNGNQITITECESEAQCHCLCLVDLDYQIANLAPGAYTIRIIGLYVEGGDQVLEFSLQLNSAASNTHCLQRNYYPWGQ